MDFILKAAKRKLPLHENSFVKATAPVSHLDLIEYSVLHYAVTQTNISYRQFCILCEMHLKFNCADS